MVPRPFNSVKLCSSKNGGSLPRGEAVIGNIFADCHKGRFLIVSPCTRSARTTRVHSSTDVRFFRGRIRLEDPVNLVPFFFVHGLASAAWDIERGAGEQVYPL